MLSSANIDFIMYAFCQLTFLKDEWQGYMVQREIFVNYQMF